MGHSGFLSRSFSFSLSISISPSLFLLGLPKEPLTEQVTATSKELSLYLPLPVASRAELRNPKLFVQFSTRFLEQACSALGSLEQARGQHNGWGPLVTKSLENTAFFSAGVAIPGCKISGEHEHCGLAGSTKAQG